jgi:prephenate dehydrogenase
LDAVPLCRIQTYLSTLEIPPPRQLTVLGIGLIGSSVLMAARARLPQTRLVAWSRSGASREAAKTWASVKASPAEACEGSDLILAAGPIDTLGELLKSAAPGISTTALLTDVGSTKRGAHNLVSSTVWKNQFVGSHPMAGSERGGAAAGKADLFVNRPCIITTPEGQLTDHAQTLQAFWQALGAQVHLMTPEAHDRAVAEISHLPHAIASLLAALLSERRPRTDLAAGGLRDTTRIAAGDSELWLPILMENADHLIPLLGAFEGEVRSLSKALASGDKTSVKALLEKGRHFRQSL